MAKIGYTRVSTTDQSLEIQIDQLKKIGCEKIFSEKKSGLDNSREEFAKCMLYLREGDTLYVTKLDRLGRSARYMRKTMMMLEEKKVSIHIIDYNIFIDNSDNQDKNNDDIDFAKRMQKAISNAFMQMVIEIANIDILNAKDRQRRGIKNRLEKELPYGRPKRAKSFDLVFEDFKEKKLSIGSLMNKYNMSYSTARRYKKYFEYLINNSLTQKEFSYSKMLKIINKQNKQ